MDKYAKRRLAFVLALVAMAATAAAGVFIAPGSLATPLMFLSFFLVMVAIGFVRG